MKFKFLFPIRTFLIIFSLLRQYDNIIVSTILAKLLRKHRFLIILAVPLFIMATTLQHSVDLQNFAQSDQAATSLPAGAAAEILEEITSEVVTHSLYEANEHPIDLRANTDFFLGDVRTHNQSVPTPPPDLV